MRETCLHCLGYTLVPVGMILFIPMFIVALFTIERAVRPTAPHIPIGCGN